MSPDTLSRLDKPTFLCDQYILKNYSFKELSLLDTILKENY